MSGDDRRVTGGDQEVTSDDRRVTGGDQEVTGDDRRVSGGGQEVPSDERRVTDRRRSALAWGATGTLTFLVGAQALVLLGSPFPLGVGGAVAVGVAVGVLVASVAYVTEPRIARKGRN